MFCGATAVTIAALPCKMMDSWGWYSSQVTLCSLLSCFSLVTVVNGVIPWCMNGGFYVLSQLSVGSLATWRISVSLRMRDGQPCSPPHILVLRLVATFEIA